MQQDTRGLITLGSVVDELQHIKGTKVYFQCLPGSNGDMVHEKGSKYALSRAGAILVNNVSDAQHVVFDGSAAISTDWQCGVDLLRDRLSDSPGRPIWILPSTFNFEGIRLGDLISGERVAPIYMWCRERGSLAILGEQNLPSCVRVGLDHDMAFHLENSPLIANLRSYLSEKHILVVERNDIESPTGVRKVKAMPGPSLVKKLLPVELRQRIKRPILRKRALKRDINRPFVRDAVASVHLAHPEFKSLPVLPWDVSRCDLCSFHEFGKFIAQSAVIVTTRLHVGIMGAMLGKRVYVRFGRALPHKFKGIYELSLEQREGVEIL